MYSLDIDAHYRMHLKIYGAREMALKTKKVLVVFPEPLLKKLDTAAKQQSRNRSAELCLRLTESLKVKQPASSGVAA